MVASVGGPRQLGGPGQWPVWPVVKTALTTARVAVATEIRNEAVQCVGDGQETPAAFLEIIRHLDEIRYCQPRSD